jgi:hypothetical protein
MRTRLPHNEAARGKVRKEILEGAKVSRVEGRGSKKSMVDGGIEHLRAAGTRSTAWLIVLG